MKVEMIEAKRENGNVYKKCRISQDLFFVVDDENNIISSAYTNLEDILEDVEKGRVRPILRKDRSKKYNLKKVFEHNGKKIGLFEVSFEGWAVMDKVFENKIWGGPYKDLFTARLAAQNR